MSAYLNSLVMLFCGPSCASNFLPERALDAAMEIENETHG